VQARRRAARTWRARNTRRRKHISRRTGLRGP
jgi:hypothetical protein